MYDMKYVLDTDVIVAGLRSRTGASRQFINVAVAEKLAALRTERYFRERAGRASPVDFSAILEKAGTDVAIQGDELPDRTALPGL